MNAPKLVTSLVVLVIAVAILYPAISSAVPKNLSETPFEVSFGDGATEIGTDDDMNLVIKMPDMTFTSRLPEDFKDVSIDVYFGHGTSRSLLGSFDFGDVPANGAISKSFESEKLPVMLLLSYLPLMNNGNGDLNFPMILDFHFKYMEWMGEDLLDIGLGMTLSGTTCDGTVSVQTSGNDSTVHLATSSSGILSAAINKIAAGYGSEFTVRAGDASFDVRTSTGTVTVTARGGSESAADALDMMLKNTGSLTFTLDGKDHVVSGEKAESIVNSMMSYYRGA